MGKKFEVKSEERPQKKGGKKKKGKKVAKNCHRFSFLVFCSHIPSFGFLVAPLFLVSIRSVLFDGFTELPSPPRGSECERVD